MAVKWAISGNTFCWVLPIFDKGTNQMHRLNDEDNYPEENRRKDVAGFLYKILFWSVTGAFSLLLLLSTFVFSEMMNNIRTLQETAKENRENIVLLKAQYEYIAGTLGEIKQFMRENRRRE